ncbi:hypothetical protein EJ08DRAFT_218500 [Tothia fuscella]|uniref:Uncharacterized protein n=1 Tax=Tothia fuscella TaxID=1048955 RepID=A0A9P4TYJ7_9PEZI|nr:hypothetical protein EJ08DRAFT_218500 [Tothia fuscella]
MSHTSSAPAIRVFPGSSVPQYGSRPHNTNTNQTSAAPQQQHHPHSRSIHNPKPMAIPRAREAPPPPLPPPRHIDGLYHGQDPGWKYGNGMQHESPSSGQYASVKAGSSLLGGVGDQEYGQPADHYDYRDSRRGSTMSLSTPIDPEMQGSEILDHSDEDRHSLPRPVAMSNFSNCSPKLEVQMLDEEHHILQHQQASLQTSAPTINSLAN